MQTNDVKVGGHVSFADAAGTHTGVVASVDGRGNAVIGSLNRAIAGAATVTKAVGELTTSA